MKSHGRATWKTHPITEYCFGDETRARRCGTAPRAVVRKDNLLNLKWEGTPRYVLFFSFCFPAHPDVPPPPPAPPPGLQNGEMFRGMWGFDGFDDGLNRGDWSEKSGAAEAREASARAAFDDALTKTPGAATTLELLKPSTHLTQPCWRDFKKYVERHPGWSAKRRKASDAEKRQHGETRKGTCYFVDVSFKPPTAPKAPKAGSKAMKKAPGEAAAQKAAQAQKTAQAQMSSSMSTWMSGGAATGTIKRPAAVGGTAAAAKKPCMQQATGFEVRFSRTSKVVEWDDETFVDCRPSEAKDSMDEHTCAAERYDCADVPSDAVESGNDLALLQLKAAAGVFATVGDANDAAKACLTKLLELEVDGDGGNLTRVRGNTSAEWSYGFTPPPSCKAPTETLGAGGRGTYTGNITLFCDVHGCDVQNVVVVELKAVVAPARV